MNISPDIVQQILTLLGQAASATTTVAPAPVATASPSWVAAVTAAFPAIVGSNGKRGSMNITKNPCFAASTKEVHEGANNEIANGKPGIWCAEACYRAAKKGIAVSEYLKAKAPAKAATPAPAAPAATVATIPPELAAMAEQMGFTLVPKADAPVAPPVKRMKGQARLTCLQTALAAAKAGDRNAAKAELVQVGLLKESDKMRLGKMLPLIEAEIAKMTTVSKAPHAGVPNLTVA